MILIKLLRFITGYVVFGGNGGFAERFINLCAQNKISLWNTKYSLGKLTACTNIKGYKKIRSCAKKSGMKVRIKSKHGFPFIFAKLFKRKGLFVGTAVALVLVMLMSNMIWTVKISGNQKYTDTQILKILEDEGIKAGAFRRNINLENVRSQIALKTVGISRMSVNIHGCHVSADIAESIGSTEVYDTTKPCNIVSTTDGEIVKIVANYGTPAAKPGSAVTKGDLLISGVMEKTDGTPYFIHAKGTATVRTNHKNAQKLPFEINVKKITKVRKIHSLYLFALEIPLALSPKMMMLYSGTSLLNYNGTRLPVGIKTDIYTEQTASVLKLSPAQCALLASYKAFLSEKTAMQNSEVITKNITSALTNTHAIIKTDIIIHKTTGIEYYFEVE